MKLKLCPTCKIRVLPDTENYPFCGERCQLIDLGNWASDEYKIPSDEKIIDDDEN